MACLVAETQLREILRQLGIERYYGTVDKSGALSLYIAPDSPLEQEAVMSGIEEKTSGELPYTDEMLYPLFSVDVEEEEDAETLEWLEGQKVFPAFRYRQQLNSWLGEPKVSEAKGQRPPRIAFYSYKGGVGRSTSLAVVARLMAKQGLKVATIDLDLEAPGLNNLLLADQKTSRFGVVDYLYHYPVLKERIDLSRYMVKEEVHEPGSKQSGQLWVMTAGGTRTQRKEDALRLLLNASNRKVDIALDPLYLEKFSYVDFDLYARQNHHVFEQLLQDVHRHTECDVILIDARTGISNVSGAILNQFSDYLSIHVQDNDQNREGIRLIAKYIKDKQKLRDAFWCHTKMPKNFDEEKQQLARFVQNTLQISNEQNPTGELRFHALPFYEMLEDVTAYHLKQHITEERVPLDYQRLAEQIMDVADLRKMLPLHMSEEEKEAIQNDFKRLIANDEQVTYISRRFLDPSLKMFVGFPGSGKKTFGKYLEVSGKNEKARILTFQEFQEQAGETHYIPTDVTFLDWTFQEATQAACKWLLQSQAYVKWLKNNPYFSKLVNFDEWEKMRTVPEYELDGEIATEIVEVVFGARKSRTSVSWDTLLEKIEYRFDYVLPGDVMMATRLVLHVLLTNNQTEGVKSIIRYIEFMGALKSIGEKKKKWLEQYDQEILNLILILQEKREFLDIGVARNYLEELWTEKYQGQGKGTFEKLLERAATLGIIVFREKVNARVQEELIWISPVYELVQ